MVKLKNYTHLIAEGKEIFIALEYRTICETEPKPITLDVTYPQGRHAD